MTKKVKSHLPFNFFAHVQMSAKGMAAFESLLQDSVQTKGYLEQTPAKKIVETLQIIINTQPDGKKLVTSFLSTPDVVWQLANHGQAETLMDTIAAPAPTIG